MAVKRYRAKSIQEAISRIKEDFGPDAMILSTRRLPVKNRAKELFEVTAALQRSASEEIEDPVTITRLARSDPRSTDSGSEEKWKELSAEIFSLKEMLFLIDQAGGLPDFLHQYPESLNLYARLVKSGISERTVRELMRRAFQDAGPDRPNAEAMTKRVIQHILSVISVADPFSVENGKPHLAAFIGPTGVGKTTTIAKLAAVLRLHQKKRVGVISVDSYRIGAVDHLRTYATIMGLPCLSAFSKRELQLALRKMRDKDIVLIDTAGQSHLDADRMKELGGLMRGDHDIACHLVLSATTERDDMKEVADKFSLLHPKSYIFTKLDETRRRGSIIDQLSHYRMPISFLTNGQRVPEDILPAQRRNLLQLILQR